MHGRLTDQAAVAVALARRVAATAPPTIAHLLLGLITEPEGRAGRRLRERASAAAAMIERAPAAPAPPLDDALHVARHLASSRAATTVDLLDAAIAAGGSEIADLLDAAGYQRDLDGWLASDPVADWFEDAETYGFAPHGDAEMDAAAARVVAQVRAVSGGAVHLLIAGAAAPDNPMKTPDPQALAAIAARLGHSDRGFDAGLEPVLDAARMLSTGDVIGLTELLQAALIAGGDAPRLVLELTEHAP